MDSGKKEKRTRPKSIKFCQRIKQRQQRERHEREGEAIARKRITWEQRERQKLDSLRKALTAEFGFIADLKLTICHNVFF